jgi:hypothetical protein
MNRHIFLGAVILTSLMAPAHANPVSRRATITGGGGDGRCALEVSVDHAAELEVAGDTGFLTTTAGQPALWRRFQCNMPLPRNPVDFRFIGTGGRGAMRLLQDPRDSGGRAVIQINDPQGGRAVYTFDLRWQSAAGGGWMPGPPPPMGHGPGHGEDGFPMARAIRACQDSVTDRLNQDGYRYVAFDRTIPDNGPGRNDWVIGRVSGRRWFETERFSFSCSVDFSSGTVRSVDLRRR